MFALHLHTFWFLTIALALVPSGWVSGLAMLVVPVYAWSALSRVYGCRRGPRLLRVAVVSGLYGVTRSVAMLGVGIWAFLA